MPSARSRPAPSISYARWAPAGAQGVIDGRPGNDRAATHRGPADRYPDGDAARYLHHLVPRPHSLLARPIAIDCLAGTAVAVPDRVRHRSQFGVARRLWWWCR